jgi:hypothetical protein
MGMLALTQRMANNRDNVDTFVPLAPGPLAISDPVRSASVLPDHKLLITAQLKRLATSSPFDSWHFSCFSDYLES